MPESPRFDRIASTEPDSTIRFELAETALLGIGRLDHCRPLVARASHLCRDFVGCHVLTLVWFVDRQGFVSLAGGPHMLLVAFADDWHPVLDGLQKVVGLSGEDGERLEFSTVDLEAIPDARQREYVVTLQEDAERLLTAAPAFPLVEAVLVGR